ncbi:MAG: Gfo/Idh/MocA family protein [Pseudonocardiaceae bacterium]
MRRRRIGVIGLGVISRYYLAALAQRPALQLAAVCDTNGAALQPFRGRVPCHDDHHELLAGTDLDGVVVTVPNDVHATVGRDALDAGLAVCLEKPLATRLTDGQTLVERARTAGVCLFTAFHRRYNCAVQSLARRLESQPPITSLTVRYLERIEDHIGRDRWYLDPARCGGGCVADNGPNAYDLARLFLGELQVTDADISRDTQGIDRQARVSLRAASGATALVELDWSYEGERKDVEILLADGSTHRADMLYGYPGFKSSLWHEYLGVVRDFEQVLAPGEGRRDGGLAALELVDATYRAERERSCALMTREKT